MNKTARTATTKAATKTSTNSAKKLTKKAKAKSNKPASKKVVDFAHDCDWRTAALQLARCVVWTLRADGKLGMGSGMVMKVVDGKRVVERWDKDFIEALAFIGLEVMEKPVKKKRGSAALSVEVDG